MENAISNLEFWGRKIWGVKCYLEFRIWGWKIWGGKCYLESRILGEENLGCKMLSRISNLGVCKICGGKCYLESLIWGWGCKFGVENAFSKLEFGGVENLG